MEFTIVELLALFSFFLSAVLVAVIIKQHSFSQKQYETVNRPWLVLGEGKEIVYDNNIDLFLENIGNLPAEQITISYKAVFYNKDKKNTLINSDKELVSIGIIVPKQKHHFTWNFLTVDEIMGCEEASIDIMVNYHFGKKEKISKFNYYIHNLVSHKEISCKEAT